MKFIVDAGTESRMAGYLSAIGDILSNKKRRESFALYAMGLMGDGEPKSCEPMAARACADPALADACHQRLTYFLGESVWSDQDVRSLRRRLRADGNDQAGARPGLDHRRHRVLCRNIVGENEPDLGRFGTVPMAGRLG